MIIQFFENGVAVTDEIDYLNTVWHDGQLTEEDEDIIEHLEIGDEQPVSGGWTVKRIK